MIPIFAILIAVIATMIAGSIWYGALFGASYRDALGIKNKDIKSATKKMPKLITVLIIAEIISASILYCVLKWLGVNTALGGIGIGALLWFGFIMPTMASNYAFGGRTLKLYMIDALHHLLCLLIMGAILGALI